MNKIRKIKNLLLNIKNRNSFVIFVYEHFLKNLLGVLFFRGLNTRINEFPIRFKMVFRFAVNGSY